MEEFTGLAQKHPNIDLSQFVGKKVYIRLNKKERMSLQNEHIGEITFDGYGYNRYNNGETLSEIFRISGFCFTKSGRRNYCSDQYITEIYDENAFLIKTKEIKEIPEIDPQVEKAKEAVKNLTEEQIAQLLHSLKK